MLYILFDEKKNQLFFLTRLTVQILSSEIVCELATQFSTT